MLSSIIHLSLLAASAVAQSSAVVCIAGQCLQGFSNTTLGVGLSAQGAATTLLLLPGQYTSSSNPALLHTLLSSSSAALSPSSGFSNSSSSSKSVSLPLTVALQPGLAAYAGSLYSGEAFFNALPTSPIGPNNTAPLTAASLSLASNVWVAITSGSSNSRIILWDSIPDVTQLPVGDIGSLRLTDMQSAACSPPCSGSGVCSASGTCLCPAGFNGTSCESCAPGFFGSTCQACPAGCTDCDDGMAGSGICLGRAVVNPPSSCNCENGVCGTDGQCSCLPGWTTGSNGTACAECSTGFFLDATGENCAACSLGCTSCAASSGDCIACKTGFTQNQNDPTQCTPASQTASDGTTCPDGSFSSNGTCEPCSAECQTCNGATSNDCILCGSGTISFNGSCVSTSASGVCTGSTLIANNNKHECDSCGPKCTACGITSFSVASTIEQAQCTGCLPGFVLSQGKCVASCPSGTFLSPKDNLTCTACDASCSTCAGSASFCLTCTNNQLASNGACVSSCPSNTFSSAGTCATCHPDCATCSGTSFNQCSSCPSNLPVLTNGRCLPTCSKSQFFDKTSSTCQSCDSSCSSCSGSGPSSCLACSSSTQVLRGGSCVGISCNGTSSVVPGLGVCLSELVSVPQASGTGPVVPLPSITGLDSPTVVDTNTNRALSWWQILLMTLGCAFIFLMVLICWRRRARKNRAKRTKMFEEMKLRVGSGNWLTRFGERLFGHHRGASAGPAEGGEPESIKLKHMRAAEEAEARWESYNEMEKLRLFDQYDYSRAGSEHGHGHGSRDSRAYSEATTNRLSSGSAFTTATGPRRIPEPRQPMKDQHMSSRFSDTTLASSEYPKKLIARRTPPPMPTAAEQLAASYREPDDVRMNDYWIKPHETGESDKSNNPFYNLRL